MKWPRELTLVRHDTSEYNVLKELKNKSPEYQQFMKLYEAEPNPTQFVSAQTRGAALCASQAISIGVSDAATDLAHKGANAFIVGRELQHEIELPDIIFVSPYNRTKQTLERMIEGWPELGTVRVVEDDRIREQEHGLATLYNDMLIFWTLHPEQRAYMELHGDMSHYWYRHMQGESVPDVRDRTRDWMATLIRDFSGKRVLAISHHLTILSLRANLERLSAAEFVDLDSHDKPCNVGVTHYLGNPAEGSDGHLTLDYYNKRLYK